MATDDIKAQFIANFEAAKREELALIGAAAVYLSPAEREFLEGSHAGRH